MKQIKMLTSIILLVCLCLSGCAATQDDVVLFDPMATLEAATQASSCAESTLPEQTTSEATTQATVLTTEPSTATPTESAKDTLPLETTISQEVSPTTEIVSQPPANFPAAPIIAEKDDQPTSTIPNSNMVWIPTKGGKKYHRKPTCSGMNGPENVTKAEAETRGFTPCKKCYK